VLSDNSGAGARGHSAFVPPLWKACPPAFRDSRDGNSRGMSWRIFSVLVLVFRFDVLLPSKLTKIDSKCRALAVDLGNFFISAISEYSTRISSAQSVFHVHFTY